MGEFLAWQLVRLDRLMSYGRHPNFSYCAHLPPWWRNPHAKMAALNCSTKQNTVLMRCLKLESLQAHSKYGTQYPIHLATIHTHHIGVSETPLIVNPPHHQSKEGFGFQDVAENRQPVYLRWWIPHVKWGIKLLLKVNTIHSRIPARLTVNTEFNYRATHPLAIWCPQIPIECEGTGFQ